ncbi:alpha/beta hydrolase [Acetohalobium arabaticum]|uniref:BAAT/Acyl-CoA thioester hydrolase n=1 Tax=Acetohalobium arabaticum (strain ATCC 49924 / DSM 5501 / Z-7288) TaxID=574087 RepID=D9QQR0_ACEAZ|nr:alpha/beta hydrolase [Acetohalobium arabaticum]ADL12851.1 BAAT/Acyl-CoA thioester hydrolase [Acetohalobium arabaticum DSM 5501]
MEKPILFGESKSEMLGILHTPECKTDYPKPAVIFCHGFQGNKIGPHRIFVKMARKLAANGITVFRFDYRGSGDSSGDFIDTTISGQIEDTLTAIDYVRQLDRVNESQLGLLGLSLGGAVAALATARTDKIKALVLWSAVADIQKVFLAQRPENYDEEKVNKQGYIDLDGYRLGSRFIAEIGEIDPLAEVEGDNNSVFLVHGSEDEVVPIENTDKYYNTFSSEVCKKHIVVGSDHTYSKHEWESEVLDKTEEWLIENL